MRISRDCVCVCVCDPSMLLSQAKIMEYHRYLKEVIQTLETDTDFRAKLQKADEADIRVSISKDF